MHKAVTTILMLILTVIYLSAQNKRDYVWLLGDNQLFPPEFGAIQFDFNNKPFAPSERKGGLNFDQNTASICDEDGKLLFYSNGCAVANRLHQIMPNGDSINHGEFFSELWLDDCRNGYPGRQDITILPDPGNEDGYYLIHKPAEIVGPMTNINFSYVDMSLDNNLGNVVSKNDTILCCLDLMIGYLSVISHENGIDWWIIQPLDDGNKYQRLLLTESGFVDKGIQEIGPLFDSLQTTAAGTSSFSPDGSKFALFTQIDGLHVYDFDRTEGLLSNYRTVDFKRDWWNSFVSCEWSANSRFLYYHTADSLWQVDTYEDELEDGRVFIAEWDPDSSDRPPRFNNTALGPDCRIYVRGGSSNNYMHVIHKPDEKGVACDFQQSGIRLPHLSSTGSFPNFPRFRVDEEEKCDPSIVSIVGEAVWWRRDLTVYPSPASAYVTVELPEHKSGTVYILDMTGQVIFHLTKIGNDQRLDVSFLSAGTYSVEFVPDNNKERVMYTSRIVVVD